MSGGLRSLRWRAALSVVGVLLVISWVWMTGRTSYIVQIDFNMGREFLEGAVVRIDGASVGTLQRYGRSQWVTGFQVEPGEHTVSVHLDDCEADTETVELSPRGLRMAVLMADWEDGYTCRVGLR